MYDKTKYFAAQKAEDTVEVLMQKANRWFINLDTNGYLDKLREMWAAYHGAFYSDFGDSHRISFTGEQGELTTLPVNHIRNFAQHIKEMITAQRPSLQARAVNNDYKSLVQTKLANDLLDYYMREKRLEDKILRAVEFAVVLGAGYVKMEWNSMKGEIYDVIETVDETTGETIKEPLYEGDVIFSNVDPFNIVYDNTKENQDHDWVLVRTFKNKYDIIAKYPDQADEIQKLPTKGQSQSLDFSTLGYEETDDIPIYEFFHVPTESLPEGRYIMYLDSDIVLVEGPMPYLDLPIYRIAPSDILGTPYGYTPLFDLLPIQDALNSLYSIILTNQSAFGVQNIMMPRGTDISANSLLGGLNLIEYNHQFGKPEPLNLTDTPAEVFKFIEVLERASETISGINSVTRGNPETSLKSGNALALMQSMSIQFMNGLQQSYVRLIEDVGLGLFNILKLFAHTPRVAHILGKDNNVYVKEFSADDLTTINRVIVDMGNPLARCLAIDTPILMYDGSVKKVQDVVVGDVVMGNDSQPRTVEKVNSGEETMYEVYDKKGNFIYGCNESHILSLRYCSDDHRYNAKKGDVVDISIKEYMQLPARHRRILMGYRTGIDFESKKVSIPPYILGLWLGDGDSATTRLTTMDEEIAKEWCDYAASIEMQVKVYEQVDNKSSMYKITSGLSHGKSDRNIMMNHLRSYNLIQNKHVPECYKVNDEQVRLELLAGFIDTDGSRTDGTFIITQVDDKLTDDIEYVAKSLGFKVTRSTKPRQTGPNTDRRVIGTTNILTIGGDTWRIPTKLPRKQCEQTKKKRNWLNYGINVIEVGEGTYYGFTLKEDPHFVLGDFTVTHNTTAGKVEMADHLLQMGAIETPEQYITVLNTGRLDVMTNPLQSELLLVKDENEKLIKGETVNAIATERHRIHIEQHSTILSDTNLKNEPELLERVLAHISEHIEMLRTVDPDLLMLRGEQPLGPVGGSPANQPETAQMINESAMNTTAQSAESVLQNAPAGGGQPNYNGPLPTEAKPPEPFTGLPTNPAEAY